jgi:membrane protein
MQYICALQPVRWFLGWTQKVSLPGFNKISIYDVAQFYFNQIGTTNIGHRAAAISYNFLIAIPAGFIFLFTVVPYLPQSIRNEFTEELFTLITAYFTPTDNTRIWLEGSLNDFINNTRNGLGVVGLFIVVWASSNAMIGIMDSFDTTIIQRKNKNFLQRRLTAIKLTTLLLFIVVACVVMLISEAKLLQYIFLRVDFEDATTALIVKVIDWMVIIFITLLSIGAIYRYAPAIDKRWSLITPGSILTTILLLLTTFIFSYWVNNFGNYNKIYGSLGTIIILMLLIYFNALVLLLGFELNNSIRNLRYANIAK